MGKGFRRLLCGRAFEGVCREKLAEALSRTTTALYLVQGAEVVRGFGVVGRTERVMYFRQEQNRVVAE